MTAPGTAEPQRPVPAGAFLKKLQEDCFRYFQQEWNPANGLVLDKTSENWPASIAATGLALACYPIGVERHVFSREEAIQRTLAALRFFSTSEQSTAADATGYKGFYYHFLDMQTGRRYWDCELSSIDTAFLLAGMLTAAAYFQHDTKEEDEIRSVAETLYLRSDWRWMQNGGATLCHGWTPRHGFLPYRWEGYDEALLLYALALGSPTHPVPAESYAARLAGYEWKNIYDIEFLYAGPLFIHQLSHVWIDLRGISDRYMRERGSDYFENSRRATYVQRQYAIKNPFEFEQYGDCCWGITACEGPGPVTLKINGRERTFFDYIARGVPNGPDDGTLAPWSVVASLPFAPEIVVPTIEHFNRLRLHELHPYGYKATFNATFPTKPKRAHGWVSSYHFGINEGPMALMVENFQTGLVWQLMRQCPYLVSGLRRAGFGGGWLGS